VRIRHVIWDWNGTLLDDVDCCVDTLNGLRAARQLAPIAREEYRERFGFPVRAFYEGIGFAFADDAEFAALSHEFIAAYQTRAAQMRLTPGAHELLAALGKRGLGHVVVSAMEGRLLGQMLRTYGLHPLLAGHHGRDDLSAGSKVEHGIAAVRRMGLDPRELVVVGDTLHDHELGEAIGCPAILYAGGHQTRARLSRAGAVVVDALGDVADHLAA
jgi:phosphoglycolate phosphatase